MNRKARPQDAEQPAAPTARVRKSAEAIVPPTAAAPVAPTTFNDFPTAAKALARLRRETQATRQRLKLRQADRDAAPAAARISDHELFVRAVGVVTPIQNAQDLVIALGVAPPAPLPLHRLADEQQVLREALSDEFDVSTLLETDAELSYRRPGIGFDVVRKLRAGHWSLQAQLDLHGLRSDEAREAVGRFIRETHHKGLRCVRIVHGKGLGSPGRTPVLKGRVLRWLVQKREVIAFVQAKGTDGGAGALVVLLQAGRARSN